MRKREGKIGDQIAKKNRCQCASFSSAQSLFFRPIRNTLFRNKQTISTFIFMQDFINEQIR